MEKYLKNSKEKISQKMYTFFKIHRKIRKLRHQKNAIGRKHAQKKYNFF